MTEVAVEQLTTSLIRALRRLGDVGQTELANRLAGEAYAGLRRDEPRAAHRLDGVMHYLARLEAAGITTGRSHQVTDDPLLDVREQLPIRALTFETLDALGDTVTASDPEQGRAKAVAAEGVEKARSVIAANKGEKQEAVNGRVRIRRELAQVLADATVDDIARIIAHDPLRARSLIDALAFYEGRPPCPSCGWSGRSRT